MIEGVKREYTFFGLWFLVFSNCLLYYFVLFFLMNNSFLVRGFYFLGFKFFLF